MVAISGQDMIIQAKDNQDNLHIIAGLRAKTIKFGAKLIDITKPDSPLGWQEFLPQAGVKMVQIDAKGLFNNANSDALLRERFFNQKPFECKIILPGFGEISGQFFITKLHFIAHHQEEAELFLGLASNGEVIFSMIN